MISQFREFLKSTNALALAIGVIVGGAAGKIVTGLVDFIIMPIINAIIPGGDWKESGLQIGTLHSVKDGKAVDTPNIIKFGAMAGAVVDFLIIMMVVFYFTKMFMKPGPAPRSCPFCGETVPDTASRCKACTSDISATAVKA